MGIGKIGGLRRIGEEWEEKWEETREETRERRQEMESLGTGARRGCMALFFI